jgi:electron-transferring-flavoprotein dehydrogenase
MRTDCEAMEYDVVVVGAGPAGLAFAIRLKQIALKHHQDISVCVLEKGAEVGAHILSGAVIEPRTLDELIPGWQSKNAPLETRAAEDHFLLLTRNGKFELPTPPQMRNAGNYIASLGKLCRWLAAQAETLGVEIFPGFPASEVLYHESGAVKGVATGDMGVDKNGRHLPNYQPGMELHARQTVFAEGCRGSLTKTLMEKFDLNRDADPQTYGIGLKELWEIPPAQHKRGFVMHTVGWPLPADTYGGSFLYHLEDNLVSVGFVVGLDYKNPWLSPFEEFQRYKTHPAIRPHLEGGRRIGYGARALSEGGFQALPKLTFPGGLLVGDTAGFMNVPKIKGTHTAMQSGLLAADAVHELLSGGTQALNEALQYPASLKNSWLHEELYRARNIRPAFRYGLWGGLLYSAIDTAVFNGRAPWTLHHHSDHDQLRPGDQAPRIDYPKPDGHLTFDRLSSVYISNTLHAENQPCHLELRDPAVAMSVNYARYGAPEIRYCPAGVYEIAREDSGNPALRINAQNCLHCKTCDIKDPTQNINWKTPEGGGGPNYSQM